MDFPNTRYPVENYNQFIDVPSDSSQLRKRSNPLSNSFDQFANDMLDNSDISTIMMQKFSTTQYPTDLMSANLFCPVCGKIVNKIDEFLLYQSSAYKRRFLAHTNCLNSQTLPNLNDLFLHVQQMNLVVDDKPKEKYDAISIGVRQFCIQLSVSHPLSDFKLIRLINKSNSSGNYLRWQLSKTQNEQSTNFQPNMICFPFMDFKISLVISQIGSQQEKKILKGYVNLSRSKINTLKQVYAKCNQFSIQLKIHGTSQQKSEITSLMNYKYRYPQIQNMPIIELKSIEIQLPEEDLYEACFQSNQTINQILTQKGQQSSQTSYSQSLSHYSKYSYYDDPRHNLNNHNLSYSPQSKSNDKNSNIQKERVDCQKLIASNKLSNFIRNGTQSRLFQKFLDEATENQIQNILNYFYQEFHQIIIHQYGNYTAQKLFIKYTTQQRIKILEKLFPRISQIVKNKQGTHTLQTFVSYLKTHDEIKLIVDSIKQQFEQLSFHPISTHFIQKIIKDFPIQPTLPFYYAVNKRFLQFATDKNAMCVLKYMLKSIHQKQKIQNSSLIAEVKKNFINSITLNTPKIIQDCFGNYVIQFCFQLFGQLKSSGITEMIIQKFVQFSLQKYSSSVLSKCITTYWTDKKCFDRLKDLNHQGLLQMYRNKEGNKILLDLLEKNENTVLWEKIHVIAQGQLTKFFQDRWGIQGGIRSGPVGIDFNSFSQADKQQRSHHNNNKEGKKSKKK